ncbi:electron transport complex subunit RsxC [Halioxenophilus sp. WMMB6]|uniref:electron transport complex subunit RsxC n=1 Tax=Halioxenophilus sp. WMMB6 TaxID=3073815 RepID=UPI00295F1C93|nr:electron transport complex subunit RsxC [Halioxenophilus sp. WMMB6]
MSAPSMDTKPEQHVRKIYPIPGGVHPPQNKAQSTQTPLTEATLPKQVILPLSQHIGAAAVPMVEVGERVLTGQLVAQAKGVVSANVHATISGTVSAITDCVLPHPSGMSGPCIVIESDGLDEWQPLEPCEAYLEQDADTLLAKIRAAGIVGMGGAGFPAAVKLAARSPIQHLIINGTECEPYITADDMLMRSYPEAVIQGTLIMAKILGEPEDLVIGLEENKPEALAALRQAAEGTRVQVVSFPCQYPSGGEKQLIQRLTGKEVPSGALPASLGCVVQNVGTAYAAFRAVRFGEPLLSRVTTVVGEALEKSANVEVRLGTPVGELLSQFGYQAKKASRLIMGGPMMGFALTSDLIPVIKTSNCLIAPSRREMPANNPPAQACIRCGLCAESCPASLLPQQLYWYARSEDFDKLESHHLFDCIECGACSYVCPSNIPLVQYYRSAKGSIRQAREDKIKSDHSRQRFEFRQARLAKVEAEKEAKRLARQQAAEKAKQKLADNPPPAAAIPTAPAAVSEAGGADAIARLERAVESAQARVTTAQERYQEAVAEGSERAEQLLAKLKQAEVRANEAKQKLAAAQAEPSATPVETSDDPVAAAIARAQAKQAMNPAEKAKANVESLQKRLAKAREKLAEATQENSDKVEALQSGVEKLEQKLADAEQELAQTAGQLEPVLAAADDPAQAAIERAKAKAAAAATLSPTEKLTSQIESLQSRLAKAQTKLAEAQAAEADNQEALALGVSKLTEKLAQAQQVLAELEEQANP